VVEASAAEALAKAPQGEERGADSESEFPWKSQCTDEDNEGGAVVEANAAQAHAEAQQGEGGGVEAVLKASGEAPTEAEHMVELLGLELSSSVQATSEPEVEAAAIPVTTLECVRVFHTSPT